MEQRRAALARGLAERACPALLVLAESASEPDLAPFIASGAHLGQTLLVAPAAGAPRLAYLTAMERDEAAAAGVDLLDPEALGANRLRETSPGAAAYLAGLMSACLGVAGIAPGPFALAGHAEAGLLAEALDRLGADGWQPRDGSGLVAVLRKRKTAAELAGIRRAAAAAGAALGAVARRLAGSTVRDGELWSEGERLTVGRLQGEIGSVLGGNGCDQPRGAIVAPGATAAVPHSVGDPERVLRAGEALVVDLFPRCGALFADCTRTFCVGEPPSAVTAAHAAVCQQLEVARRAVRPGEVAFSIHARVCEGFASAGYRTLLSHPGTTIGYVHGLGHGVGFELHEQPIFRRNSGAAGELATGDVLTLEPGLYDPEAGFGIRVEDLVALGAEGTETLTPLPEDLDPRAWGAVHSVG